jgi:uncharacterized OB-fold protein
MTILEPRISGIPVPNPSALSLPYWEGTRVGELRFQRCGACGAANFGAGLVCRTCRAQDLAWEASSGHGSLYSWTIVWRPQTPAFDVPYAPAIVRIDEGYDMVSAVIGCSPEDMADGMSLSVEFHGVSDEVTLPFFSPS